MVRQGPASASRPTTPPRCIASTGRASQAKYVCDVLDAKAVSQVRQADVGRARQGQDRDAQRQHREARRRLERVAGARRSRQARRRQRGRQDREPARPLPAVPRSRSRTTPRACAASARTTCRRTWRPRCQDVTVELATKESLPTLKDSAAKPRSPVLRVKWKIDNPDGDDTTYTLEARRDGEANWRPVATGKTPLTATQWEWNTETYPDGWYRVRVTSSDAARELAGSRADVEPRRRRCSRSTTRGRRSRASRSLSEGDRARDRRASTIAEMAFSVDDGPWQLGTTADGLFDDLTEDLRIDLPQRPARAARTRSRCASPTRPATSARRRRRSS